MAKLSYVLLVSLLIFHCTSNAEDKYGEIIGRDKHFIAYSNGIVFDTKTNLEWVAGPDINAKWEEARRWVEKLDIDGGGWRMPTIMQLKTLYIKGYVDGNITPLFKTFVMMVWSGEFKKPYLADKKDELLFTRFFGFHFIVGKKMSFAYNDSAYGSRGFAVRSRKK
jgi:hypothetical protein